MIGQYVIISFRNTSFKGLIKDKLGDYEYLVQKIDKSLTIVHATALISIINEEEFKKN